MFLCKQKPIIGIAGLAMIVFSVFAAAYTHADTNMIIEEGLDIGSPKAKVLKNNIDPLTETQKPRHCSVRDKKTILAVLSNSSVEKPKTCSISTEGSRYQYNPDAEIYNF